MDARAPRSPGRGDMMGIRGRCPPGLQPPGLQTCHRGSASQDAGSAPPSPHTPVPPVVWDSGVGLDAEHLPTGALTPPRGKRPPFSVAVRIRPPPTERPGAPLGGAKQPPREPPPSQAEGWRWCPPARLPPSQPGRSTDLRTASGLAGPPASEGAPPLWASEEGPPGLELPVGSRQAPQAKAPQQVLNVQGSAPEAPATHLSLGSVGHPHSCAAACRYVKRKGGCREGVRCPNCHLCFWRRDREQNQEREPDSQEPAPSAEGMGPAAGAALADAGEGVATLISVGTQGHPHSCAAACRYVRRKSGCRNGAACPNCHACLWTRELQSASGGVGQGTRPGLLRESTQTLEELIRLYLTNQQSSTEVATNEQGPGPLGATVDPVAAWAATCEGGGPLAWGLPWTSYNAGREMTGPYQPEPLLAPESPDIAASGRGRPA